MSGRANLKAMADQPADGQVDHRTLLAGAVARLERSGLPSPDVDARRILECAIGVSGPELALHLGESATVGTVSRLDAMLGRRSDGEPLQYVLGAWSFRTLDLMVDRRVLIPRPETEVVVGHALGVLAGLDVDDPVVVDLGTGSGAIALAIATECPTARVTATDCSAEALQVARANLAGIGRAAARVRLLEGSWFEALPDQLNGRIDLIVANPPDIGADEPLPTEVVEWEPAGALIAGPTGTEALEHVLLGSVGWLRPGGSVVLELAPSQADDLRSLALTAGYEQASVHTDLSGRARLVVASTATRPGDR
jgi:release factor glutamine methyltransferase